MRSGLKSAKEVFLKKGPMGIDSNVKSLDSVKEKLANW